MYCAATDIDTLNRVLAFGTKMVKGKIFGIPGILLGLSKLRGIQSVCLLVETTAQDKPDIDGAIAALKIISAMLRIKVDLSSMKLLAPLIKEEVVST